MIVTPDTMTILTARDKPGASWYAYENQAFDSSSFGSVKYLQCGDGCTIAEPPATLAGMSCAVAWAYVLVGTVDTDTGVVRPMKAA